MIPAIVNARGGSADEARAALDEAGCFDVQLVEPPAIAEHIQRAVDAGAARVTVAGGDGTIGTAAAILAGTRIEMAVVPGGTLNHCARDPGVPTDGAEAVRAAASGVVRGVDVGYVNQRLFLNTCSAGAYVTFVRARERLEPRLGYHLASVAAFVRIAAHLSRFSVELEVNGQTRRYRTPLVFIGVGERDLKLPHLGGRTPNGGHGLHVLVLRGKTRARLFALALAAAARGVRSVARTPDLEAFLVDRVRIDMPRRRGNVAVDGEIVAMSAPLDFRIARDALRIVVPAPVSTPPTTDTRTSAVQAW
ncbi:MAG: hypothetical protein NVS1B4_00630 [Gemmatimonadaceae bacterium]